MTSGDKAFRLRTLREPLAEEFSHAQYAKHLTWLCNTVERAINNPRNSNAAVFFAGPSRVGKTYLLESLNIEYGAVEHSSTGQSRRLLCVRVPEGGTAGSILAAILAALNEPYSPAKNLDVQRHRVQMRLKALGIAVVIFDEIQHAVDQGRKTAVRAASDFLKGLIDENPQVTFIFSGLPMCSRLREENPQLLNRSDKPRYFTPYSWYLDDERQEFGDAVVGVHDVVVNAMADGAPDVMRFIEACYLLSGGCFGVVIRFLRSVADVFEQDACAEFLTNSHLAEAFERTSRDSEYLLNPFEDATAISSEMLIQTWRNVMVENGLQSLVSAGVMVGVKQ